MNSSYAVSDETAEHLAALTLNILLVEDSALQQQIVSLLLRQLGHSVTVASDGFEALSEVQQNSSYNVIFMDCQMPLMDGFEATRLIKEFMRLKKRQIAIIGVSAEASPEECFAAGMNDFLRKPVNKQILTAVLSRWTRHKRVTSLARLSSELIK